MATEIVDITRGGMTDVKGRVRRVFLNTLEWAEEVTGRAINLPGTVDDRVMLEVLKFFGAKLLPEKELSLEEKTEMAKFKLVVVTSRKGED